MHQLIVSAHEVASSVIILAPPVPNPNPQAPPGLSGPVNMILGWMKWGGIAAGVAGLLASGIMMALGRRGRHNTAIEGVTGIGWALGGITVVSFAVALVGAVV